MTELDRKPELDGLPVADSWWSAVDVGLGITRLTEHHVDPFLGAHVFVVHGTARTLVVDAGLGIVSLRQELERRELLDGDSVTAIATHTHFDHVGSLHEFDERLVHAAEAENLRIPTDPPSLFAEDVPPELLDAIEAHEGVRPPSLMIDALPTLGWNPRSFNIRPSPASGLLAEGDELDLGDRRLRVLHLPGHSPGSIGLHDVERGVLIAGDAVYDGLLVDDWFPDVNLDAYIATMQRLITIDVDWVLGGHGDGFDGRQMHAIAADFIKRHRGRQP